MMSILKSPLAFRSLRVALVAATTVFGVFAGTQNASATTIVPVTLGAAASYGLLIGNSTTTTNAQKFIVGGGLNISGNVGIGQDGAITLNGSASVSGNVYEDSGVTQTGSGTASISGSVITQSMASVISAAATASTNAKNDSTGSMLTTYGSSINITSTATSVAIKALSAGENILNISALSLANGTLTFDDNGFTNAKFIVNITGNLTVSGTSTIKGINGASADDILFNVTGVGSTISLTGSSSNQLIGTILAPQANVTLGGGGTLTGAILQGFNNANKPYTVTEQSSGFNITALGYTPSTVTKTPEPSTVLLFGAGILGLVVARRRTKRS